RGGNEEGGDLARAALQERPVLPLNNVEPSDPRADVNAHTLGHRRLDLEAGLLHGELGARHGHLDEPAHLLHFFFFDVLERVKALDLGGDRYAKTGGIKMRDGTHATPAGQNVFPAFLRAHTKGAHESYARHHHSSCQTSTPPRGAVAPTRTARGRSAFRGLRVRLDVIDGVFHALDLLR